MPWCAVPGCSNYKKAAEEGVIFHTLPSTDLPRCKLWLAAIKNDRYPVTTPAGKYTNIRVCSQHFVQGDYKRDMRADLLGERPRRQLSETAVPSVFPFPVRQKQKRRKPTPKSAQEKRSRAEDIPECSTAPVTSSPLKDVDTSYSCEVTVESYDESIRPETGSSDSSSGSDSEDEGDPDGWRGSKTIVYDKHIMQLFKLCQRCGRAILEWDVSQMGAQMRIKWSCYNGHSGTWKSCPDLGKMPEIDMLVAGSTLFTGGTYIQLEEWSKTLNLNMICHSTFYEIQRAYLHPAIDEMYKLQQNILMAQVYLKQLDDGDEAKGIKLCGEACTDSPGYSAKYSTYTFMLNGSKKILQSHLVQVKKNTRSFVMEAVGFERGLQEILKSGLSVDLLTTDRSPFIRKMMLQQFPWIKHKLDVWHISKGVHKNVWAKARKRDYLETFHSLLVKYAPKCQMFDYQGMQQRTHLAILDHNENTLHRRARKHTGELKLTRVYCRRPKQRVLRKVIETKTSLFREKLMQEVIRMRRGSRVKCEDPSGSPHKPSPPADIVLIPKPPKAETT
ncbi:uncharacterized protein LOC144542771 [Centroberyx gerrardi]